MCTHFENDSGTDRYRLACRGVQALQLARLDGEVVVMWSNAINTG
jgi:hypothetical protein